MGSRDEEVVIRNLASHAGRMLIMGLALTPVRMTLRAIFKHIRPSRYKAGWEALVPKEQGMIDFMKFWMPAGEGGEGNLKKWNNVGSPIVPELGLDQLELIVDAGEMVEYKLIRIEKPLRVLKGVSTLHVSEREHQVHKEVEALRTAVRAGAPLHHNKRVVVLVDASATVGGIEKGASSSAVVNRMVQDIWEDTLQHGWSLRVEHVPGSEMIKNGVDGLSRLHEFRIAARIRRQVWDKWGRPTLDWWASRKLQLLDRFCTKGGGGAQ